MYTLRIEKMNCMSCVHNIEDSLKELDATAEVSADLKLKSLTVKSQKTIEEITKVIEDSGYAVTKEDVCHKPSV